ncbi:MAG TPA: ABC transporter permease subunit [Alphaproteobacteria bacterium]|jgi:general L-amino acid transport system permease protein
MAFAALFTARYWTWRRLGALSIQALIAAAVLAVVWAAAENALANLARLKIKTGFEFLERPAGFAIAQRLIPYSESSSYFAAFLTALLNTLVLAAVAILIATPLGFAIGVARRAPNQLLAGVATAYVETLRNVPLLLQLFFWYFAVLQTLPAPRASHSLLGVIFLNNRGLILPAPADAGSAAIALGAILAVGALAAWGARILRRRLEAGGATGGGALLAPALAFGAPLLALLAAAATLHWERPVLSGFNFAGGIVVIPEFVAMALALSLYSAAYIAEIVRAGIASVAPGQVEAARALGLPPAIVSLRIVIPQALRAIVPPLANEHLRLLRNTTLAAAIAYPDLMLVFAGTVLNQTVQAFEVMAITVATYLAISLVVSAAMNLYNRRVLQAGG